VNTNKQFSLEQGGKIIMKTNLKLSLAMGMMSIIGLSTSAHATRITTGNLNLTTTAASPMTSNINATPTAIIRLDVGGANFINATTPLSVSVTVDTSTPVVTVGTAANQAFKDDATGAAYFGYYLSVGERSSNQSAANINVKVKKGSGETSGRSYYLLGNGTTTPAVQGDLTVAPAAVTTFATGAPNGVHCGPSNVANGLSGTALNCAGGSTVANMDITQFVKVLYADPTSAAIVSSLEFTAVNE
jgi:hypothetical protein